MGASQVGRLHAGLEGGSSEAYASFEKARVLGEKLGDFSLEGESCAGMSDLAKEEGREGDALALGQQALIAAGTLNTQPSTLTPRPSTLDLHPSTLNPRPSPLTPQPSTLNPQPYTLNPKPRTPDPKPSTPYHKPQAPYPQNSNPQPQTPNFKPQLQTRSHAKRRAWEESPADQRAEERPQQLRPGNPNVSSLRPARPGRARLGMTLELLLCHITSNP